MKAYKERKTKVDMDVVFKNALTKLRKQRPNHPIFKVDVDTQILYMKWVLEGQSFAMRSAFKNGDEEIALPALGKFTISPLRKIAVDTAKKFSGILDKYEIKELIKQGFAKFYKDNPDYFKKKIMRGQVYEIDNHEFKTKVINQITYLKTQENA